MCALRNIIPAILLLYTLCYPYTPLNADESRSSQARDVIIRASIYSPKLDFQLQRQVPGEEDGKFTDPVVYFNNPNWAYNTKVYVDPFGLSLTVGSDKDNENSEKYGKTRAFDMHMYYFTPHTSWDLVYQRYRGFYLDNPEKYGYSEGDDETIFSHVKTVNLGLQFYYIFSDEFSFKNAIHLVEKPKKYAFSLILMSKLNYFRIASDRPLIPETEKIYYEDDAEYSGGRYYSLGVAPGVGLVLPVWNLYLSSAIFIGGGIMYNHYQKVDKTISHPGSFMLISFKGSIGYSSETFFCGFSICLDSNSSAFMSSNEIQVDTYSGFFEISAGIRI